MMRGVAVDAAYVVLQMRRARVVAVFLAVGVATQAALADLFRGGVLEREDFRLVAAAFDVSFPRAVAGFAAVPLGPFLGVERGYEVW